MSIDKLTEFAKLADENSSNTEGLDLDRGFPSKLQPARQWFNWLFNALTKKLNEVVEQVNENGLAISNEAEARTESDNELSLKIQDLENAPDALGINQAYEDVTSSRVAGETYQNTTDRPIFVTITPHANSTIAAIYVNDVKVTTAQVSSSSASPLIAIVTANSSYRFEGASVWLWTELR